MSPISITHEQGIEWLEGLTQFNESNMLIFLAITATLGRSPSYLDVGCGTGAMVRVARALGIDALGVDQLPHEKDYLLVRDLRDPLDLGRTFALVTSIEVAEHIERDYADTLSDTIARHVAPGGTLVFTAAMPGQPGNGHVNCQPAEYWRKRFHDRGLHYNAPLTYRLALAMSIAQTPLHHLEANLQVFSRG